jgi:hypothetical protein
MSEACVPIGALTARGTASTPEGVALEAQGRGLVRPAPQETQR